MSRRSELQRKTQEIELELTRQPEIDQGRSDSHIEAVRITSEAAARFEEERGARVAAEQAKAEAETKLREMEAKLIESEERLRQANAKLQQEALKYAKSEERANELEVRLGAENAKARRIEENYRAEIDWLRSELEVAVTTARETEESHKTEMARITAEAESRAHEAEVATRQQYQIKVEEAIASAQAAMFNLEETHKKLEEAEARYQETGARARQAETQLRQIELILKMNSALIGQALQGPLQVNGKNGSAPFPFDLPAEIYEGLNGVLLSTTEAPRTAREESASQTLPGNDGRHGGGAEPESGSPDRGKASYT
jgi:hypothetical protein